MTANPYAPTNATANIPRRPVRRYLALSVLSFLLAVIIATPAAVLLLHKWRAARMGGVIFGAEINGYPVSIDAIIGWSLGLSVPLWLAWFGLAYMGLRNRRRNSRVAAGRASATA